MYKIVNVWYRTSDVLVTRFACFQNIFTNKYVVQHMTNFRTEDFSLLMEDEDFVRQMKNETYKDFELLYEMNPGKRQKLLSPSVNEEGYDSLKDAIDAFIQHWYGMGIEEFVFGEMNDMTS